MGIFSVVYGLRLCDSLSGSDDFREFVDEGLFADLSYGVDVCHAV